LTSNGLTRRIGLSSAVALNMMDMIGVGPFLTLPLVIAAAGSRFAVWAWLLGAFIAVCDGLVCAELGAAFPRAGGSYAFLRQIYGEDGAGRWISFLYVWQLSFSAPLSIASGCIGLATFLAYLWPALNTQFFVGIPWVIGANIHGTNFAAAATCILVTALLYRNLTAIAKLAWVLFAGVLLTLAGVIVSGFVNGAHIGVAHSRGAGLGQFSHLIAWPSGLLLPALAQATMITCYDYWGYYNICFLGSEVKRPEKTIPRAILISIAVVATLYVTMNLAVLPSLGAVSSVAAKAGVQSRLALVAEIAQSAFGRVAGQVLAALILWSAFASVFSLLLGYSRVPYAAARDGNYFSGLAAVHARHGFPHRSLIAPGGDPDPAAVPVAAGGRHLASIQTARPEAPFPNTAVSTAAARRHGRVSLHPRLPAQSAPGTGRGGRHCRKRNSDLHHSGAEPRRVAVCKGQHSRVIVQDGYGKVILKRSSFVIVFSNWNPEKGTHRV